MSQFINHFGLLSYWYTLELKLFVVINNVRCKKKVLTYIFNHKNTVYLQIWQAETFLITIHTIKITNHNNPIGSLICHLIEQLAPESRLIEDTSCSITLLRTAFCFSYANLLHFSNWSFRKQNQMNSRRCHFFYKK